MSSVRLGCLDYEMSRRAICLGWGDVVSMPLSYASSLKGFNTYDFVICVVVLQYDKSVSCHRFHPFVWNSQEYKSLQLKPILRLLFLFIFFNLEAFFIFPFFFSWNFHFLDIRHSRHLKLYNLSMICHSNNIKLWVFWSWIGTEAPFLIRFNHWSEAVSLNLWVGRPTSVLH